MTDIQFDDFFNDKLRDHKASVPPGLWDKVKDSQFDQFLGDKLKDASAPVPEGLWDKITDGRFDDFISGKLYEHTAPVPAGLWDKVTDGQFDGFIAGKLYSHSAPVPEGLWEKVKPRKEDERRPAFIIFRYPAAALLILALLLGGSLGGYLFLKNGRETATNEITPPTPSANTANNKEDKEKPNATAVTDGHTEAAIAKGRKDGQAATLLPSSADENKNTKEDKHLNSEASDKHGNSVTGAASLLNATVSSSARKAKTGMKQENNQWIRNGIELSQPGSKDNQANIGSHHNTEVIDRSSDAEDNGFDFIEPYHSNVLTGVPVPFAMERNNSMFDLPDKKLSTANHTNQFRNVIICPADKKNHNTDWFLEAYVSPDVALKSVSNNRATQQYLLTKDSSETMQVSYSAGLRLVKPINDNLLLKAGLQYSQVNQKYVYRTENEVKTTTVVTVRTIIRAPGDTVIVHDTSTVQQIGFKNNTVYNHFKSFDIPVTVGYQFGNDDLKFGINAGLVFNITSWYQGVILDSSLATVTLNKTGNGVYKTNIGMGLYAGFSVVKQLGEDLHIFLEPYFRYNLSNMTNAQAAYNQKFSLGGLAVGLRLNLNRK